MAPPLVSSGRHHGCRLTKVGQKSWFDPSESWNETRMRPTTRGLCSTRHQNKARASTLLTRDNHANSMAWACRRSPEWNKSSKTMIDLQVMPIEDHVHVNCSTANIKSNACSGNFLTPSWVPNDADQLPASVCYRYNDEPSSQSPRKIIPLPSDFSDPRKAPRLQAPRLRQIQRSGAQHGPSQLPI